VDRRLDLGGLAGWKGVTGVRIPVDNLGKVGVIRDIYAHDLPPEAFTLARNLRPGAHGAEKFLGHSPTLGTESAGWTQAPIWLFHVPVAGGVGYWVGAGLTKVYARDASVFTESNITRQSGGVDVNYAATESGKWNGGMFGGILVLNNGIDLPQYWSNPASVATRLANLTATGASPWDTNHRCAVMRPFGRFLVALDITKSGVRYPQLVKWGHPAEAGAMPNSWDTADPANDAGEYPLQDATGYLVEQMVMRDTNELYTTDQVWHMNNVQGGLIFGFKPFLREQGALATNCVARLKKDGMQHVVLGGDDLFIHNGQTANSIVTPTMRRWFFQQIDPTYYSRSFVLANPAYNEIWVCVPENGMEQPTLALVWNWETGAIGFRDLLKDSSVDTRSGASTYGTPCIAAGTLEATTAEAWDNTAGSWDAQSNIWDARSTSPVVPRLLMADRSTGKRTFLLDNTQEFDGEAIPYYIERTGLALLGRDREGNAKTDTETLKLLTEFWPKFDCAAGTAVTVEIGIQNNIDDPVTWQGSYTYTVGTDPFIPMYHCARYYSYRISLTSSAAFRALGFALEIAANGKYH
jgi:hypothetical protein